MNTSVTKPGTTTRSTQVKKGKLVVLVSFHLGDLGYTYFYQQELKTNLRKIPVFSCICSKAVTWNEYFF